MWREGFHQRPHTRRSKYGKVFRAGRGKRNMVTGHKDKHGNFHPHTKYHRKGIYSGSIKDVHSSVEPTGMTTSRFLKKNDWKEARRTKERDDYAEELQKDYDISSILTNKLFLNGVATTITMMTGNPLPMLAVKIFNSRDYASKIIDYLNENERDRKITLVKEIASLGSSILYPRELNEASKEISNAIISSGHTNQFARQTTLDVEVVNCMLEATVQDAVKTGLDKLPSVVVDAIW